MTESNGHSPLNGHTALAIATGKVRRTRQAIQAARLQGFAYDAAMALRAACTDPLSGAVTMDVKTAVAVQKLIGAWDIAADRLRVLRGRGLPAAVRTKAGPSRQAQPIEPA